MSAVAESNKSNTEQSQTHFDAVIVGAGFSGLLCASYLSEAGIDNVRILEMNPGVGGVWSHGGVGAYPGAACDVPSYLYLPFLDRTGFIPSKKYVSQPEIASYAEMLTDHLNLRDKISFSRKVTELKYIGQGDKVWQITSVDPISGKDEQVITARHTVSANGPLSSPRMPEFAGTEKFKGESFHTAQWDKSAKLTGKKVGIIGTGASAAQVISAIVDDVESLHVFQRTPTWCMRRDDEPTPPYIEQQLKAGGYSDKIRHVDWKGELPPLDPQDVLLDLNFDMIQDPEQNEAICADLRKLIMNDVDDPELAKRLTPDYPFFCKRVLFIDDYYTSFNKPHVTLVDDTGGVVSVDETGINIARGEHFDVDVIIYATGFDSNFIPFPIIGKNDVSLADKFGANESNRYQMTRPHSLWGIHVDDMPNFYMMIGPQSLNPVTNVTLLCEEQAKYISELVSEMVKSGKTEVEPSKAAVEDWTARCETSAEGKVWLRCNNWYMKTTITDVEAGRERSSGMWMESYDEYLHYIRGGKGGSQGDLLNFS